MHPFATAKLTGCVPGIGRRRARADVHDVLWLTLTWTALIALWGCSDRWKLGDLGRRVAHAFHHPRERSRAAGPLD